MVNFDLFIKFNVMYAITHNLISVVLVFMSFIEMKKIWGAYLAKKNTKRG